MAIRELGTPPEADPRPRKWAAPFFSVWSGAAISLIGSRVAQFALVWWLTEKTGSATVLATASLVALIPEIALGPIAGAYVDRWDRRRVMIVSDGFVALVSLWLAYLFWLDNLAIWHVYMAMFLRAVAGSFHWPALSASTSLMVPKEHLSRVAGANQTLYGMLNIIGPPLGALFMAIMPLFGVMLMDVGTASLAILPLLFVRVPRPDRQAEQAGGQTSIWSDIKVGFKYMRAWPGLMALIGMAMVLKIALTPAFSLLPLLVSQHFQGDAAQRSLLEAIFGGGRRRDSALYLGGLQTQNIDHHVRADGAGSGFSPAGDCPGHDLLVGVGRGPGDWDFHSLDRRPHYGHHAGDRRAGDAGPGLHLDG